ncbi:MAG: TIM barrel protein, partial [Nanoarchaeota archaeon]
MSEKDYFGNALPFKKDYIGNLDSSYIPQYSLGAPTSPQTANQIAEATSRLNAGVYGVDISMVNPEIMEQIPKQHFKEIDRLMKLTGAKATMHAPIVDLAGFTQQGWQEEARKETERQVKFFVERAHDLDEDGNTPINFHINTGMPGEQWRKLSKEEYNALNDREKESVNKIAPNEYEVKETEGIVNRETGQVNLLRRETKQYPGGVKVWTPEERLRNMNQTEWDKEKLQVFEYQRLKSEVEDRMQRINQEIQPYIYAQEKGVLKNDEQAILDERLKEKHRLELHTHELDTHIHSGLNEVFNQLKYAPESKPIINEMQKNYLERQKQIVPVYKKMNEFEKKIAQGNGLSEDERLNYQRLNEQFRILENQQSRDLQIGLNDPRLPTPEIWTPSNKIAREKTTETVANVAFDAYNKYKEHTPIIVLENYQPGLTLGRAEDMKKTVEETRNKFAEKLNKEKNISKDKAKEIAEKLIGVTWDVGHINFLRKHGYNEEDIKRETEKIAPFVKQVHITDNFGFNDAHLPPGMGNAPIKEQLKILEKKGFKFDKGNVIVEAGAFVAQFKENPHLYALEYFESPLYTYKTMPYWKDIWETEGKYGLGYGPTLPEQHYAMYGSGFSSLPLELGGQAQGDRSRFA